MSLQPGCYRQSWPFDRKVTRDAIGAAPECTVEAAIKRHLNRLRQKAGLPLVG